MNRPAVMSVDSSGMTTTGMTPRTPLCTFQPEIQRATNPPTSPVTRPPRKPAPSSLAIEATDDAGHQAGSVGDGEGDEAGEDRHEEPERGAADDEAQRGPRGEAERVEALGDVEVPVGGRVPYLTISMAPCSPIATCASMNEMAIRMPPAATNGIM